MLHETRGLAGLKLRQFANDGQSTERHKGFLSLTFQTVALGCSWACCARAKVDNLLNSTQYLSHVKNELDPVRAKSGTHHKPKKTVAGTDSGIPGIEANLAACDTTAVSHFKS